MATLDNRKQHDGIGPTIASKLLAAKRPRLIPVHDQFVTAALTIGDSEWAFWQAVARDPNLSVLLSGVEKARKLAGVPDYVSVLRVIDVIVWMRQHGWTMHTADCRLGCELAAIGLDAVDP